MNELRNTLLIFVWGIPFFFFLGRLSFFYSDEFLGNWILTPKEYSLSYSIFFGVVFFCSTIFNFILGNIKNYSKLISILLGIFLGSIINLCFLIFGFLKFVYYFNWIFALFFIIIFENIWKLTGIIPPTGWEKNILIICWAMALLFLFNLLAKKLDDLKEKIWLAILIVSLPFFPMIIAPLVGSFIGDRLSSESSKKLSPVKRTFLGIPLLTLIIFGFIGIMKFYHLPGLIISPNLRANANLGNHNIFVNSESRYKAAINKLSNCQLINNEIGEIKNIALFEGNNYEVWDFVGPSEGSYLHIQIIGENKQAFVKGCFKAGGPGDCFFAHYDVKLADQNKAKIFSDTGVKTIDISECL